jgi:hypothetical protein
MGQNELQTGFNPNGKAHHPTSPATSTVAAKPTMHLI